VDSAACLAAKSDLLDAERTIACLETSASLQSAVRCSREAWKEVTRSSH